MRDLFTFGSAGILPEGNQDTAQGGKERVGQHPGITAVAKFCKDPGELIHQPAGYPVKFFNGFVAFVTVQGEMGNHAPLRLLFDVIIEEVGDDLFDGQLVGSDDLVFKVFNKPTRIPDGNFHKQRFLAAEVGINGLNFTD